jgi:hypothetical protein
VAPKLSHSNNMVWRLCKHGSPYFQHWMLSEALHSWSVRVSSHSQGSGSDVSGSMHLSICTMSCSLPSTNQHCTPFAVCSIQIITMRPLRSGLAINCTQQIYPTVVGCPRCTTTPTYIFPAVLSQGLLICSLPTGPPASIIRNTPGPPPRDASRTYTRGSCLCCVQHKPVAAHCWRCLCLS